MIVTIPVTCTNILIIFPLSSNTDEPRTFVELHHPCTEEEWKVIDGKLRPGRTSCNLQSLRDSNAHRHRLWQHDARLFPDEDSPELTDLHFHWRLETRHIYPRWDHGQHQPPPDQDQFDRLTLLYFLPLADDVEIVGSKFASRAYCWDEARKRRIPQINSKSCSG